jgi:FAD-dependent urate hydroxylase
MSTTAVAIIGAGPYGMSLAAHLRARGIEHRIFGRPMEFWSQIADAGGERYLKSFCFGTNISTPTPGFTFADYSRPRGLETFEPCLIEHFAAYGLWFQKQNVPCVEAANVANVAQEGVDFAIDLESGERCTASRLVVATGLGHFAHVPKALASLPSLLVMHSSEIASFADFKGRDVAVIGGGQSALEAAALLNEFGARPQLIVREQTVLWQSRTVKERSLWRRLRSPISGLGSGPVAWALTNFPNAIHYLPDAYRTRFVKSHLPAEGAWWLRERVMNRVPIHLGMSAIEAREKQSGVELLIRDANNRGENRIKVDHVIVGTGFVVDVNRLSFLEAKLRTFIDCVAGAPRLNSAFEASIAGLHFIGPSSAMSFGPLFRFVVGAEYTVGVVSAYFAASL